MDPWRRPPMPPPGPAGRDQEDMGLFSHLVRQRRQQRQQRQQPVLLRLREEEGEDDYDGNDSDVASLRSCRSSSSSSRTAAGSRKKNGPGPSPARSVRALVDDQVELTRFWTDWRAAEHRFLADAAGSTPSGIKATGAAAASKGARSDRRGGGGGGRRTGSGGAAAAAAGGWSGMDEDEEEEEEENDEEDLEALLRLSVSEPAAARPDPASAPAASPSPSPTTTARTTQGRSSAGSPLSFSNTASPPKVVERRDSKQQDQDGQPEHAGGSNGSSDAGKAAVDPQLLEAAEARVQELEAKLVETESLLGSDTGATILALERELAQAKLALAHTEAEKDELEVQLCNLQAQLHQGQHRGGR